MDKANLKKDFEQRYGKTDNMIDILTVSRPLHLIGYVSADGSQLLSCPLSMSATVLVRGLADKMIEVEYNTSNVRYITAVSELGAGDDNTFKVLEFLKRKRYDIPGAQFLFYSAIPDGDISRKADIAAVMKGIFAVKGENPSIERMSRMCCEFYGQQKSIADFNVMFGAREGKFIRSVSKNTGFSYVQIDFQGYKIILTDLAKEINGKITITDRMVSEEKLRMERCMKYTDSVEKFAKEFTDTESSKKEIYLMLEKLSEHDGISGIRIIPESGVMAAIVKDEWVDGAVAVIQQYSDKFLGYYPMMYITSPL